MTIENRLFQLFYDWSGIQPDTIVKLPGSGSNRIYYRLKAGKQSAIGAWNLDIRENNAFVSFSRHFKQNGLNVPEVYEYKPDKLIYLLQDLGDTTLYQQLVANRDGDKPVLEDIVEYYKRSLHSLAEFQINAGRNIDYGCCYPRSAFDRQSMIWDLSYFKYYFLKLAGIPFDEQSLEDDFNKLSAFILEADDGYFLYRDFQSRNIMIHNGEPWFIDYQGGRKGALQYDLASILFDGKANLSNDLRAELLQVYLDNLTTKFNIDSSKFLKYYPAFILIRILQALGAYGYRGYFEKKSHFLLSIPFALDNLRMLRTQKQIDFGLNSLMKVIDLMTDQDSIYYKQIIKLIDDKDHLINEIQNIKTSTLTIRINSFSYKKAIPDDRTGNGGGFVFDCRALPNPGRFDQYKEQTGRDQDVIDFLKNESSVKAFLNNVYALVNQSVEVYKQRGFENLMVSFGCTGGRHRSVYCAENLASYLSENPYIKIVLRHIEQEY